MEDIKRVVESFPLFDTVMISNQVGNEKGWVNTYAQLAALNKISFFDQRNSSDVSKGYCNLDAKERFPYGYKAYSYGILFQAPSMGVVNNDSDLNDLTVKSMLFQYELPKHCSVTIKLERDTIIESNCILSPSGSFPTGGPNFSTADPLYAEAANSSYMAGGIGSPQLINRFPFPNPYLDIPEGKLFNIELEFSQYGKDLLTRMGATGSYGSSADGEVTTLFDPAALIQVSLIGERYVAQRGEITAQV